MLDDNTQELVKNARNPTVTDKRLNERGGFILDLLEVGEQPHYILDGNQSQGVRIEGGATQQTYKGSPFRLRYLFSAFRTVVTDQRIIICIITTSNLYKKWELDYDSLTSVGLSKNVMDRRLVLETPGRTYHVDTNNGLLSLLKGYRPKEGDVRECERFVRNQIHGDSFAGMSNERNTKDCGKVKDSNDGSEEDTLEEKIVELKELNEDGLISDGKFEKMMDEIEGRV